MSGRVRLEGVGLVDTWGFAGSGVPQALPVAALPQPLTVKLGDTHSGSHSVPQTDYDKNLVQPSKRGGVLLTLPDGYKVQLGVPMWANKDVFWDWIRQGGFAGAIDKDQVPYKLATIFVFDPDYVHDGLIPLDFLQYLFFVTKDTTMNLVLPNQKMAAFAESMLDLAYLGDRQHDLNALAAAEYAPQAAGKPRLLDELKSFEDASPHILREINYFNDEGRLDLPNGYALKKLGPQLYGVYQGDAFLGRVNLKDYPLPKTEVTDLFYLNPQNQVLRDNFIVHGHGGVWPIGTAHGFDVVEETSGHMIWNRGRFLLVDPPSITVAYLEANHIPLDLCDGVIVTHGHSDHCGNSINHLLEKMPRVNLYATESIYTHLMAQYLLAQGGFGEIDWGSLHEAFTKAVGDAYPELHKKFDDNKSRATDDPLNIFLYVDLLLAAKKDSRLAEYAKTYLSRLTVLSGTSTLGDWNFVGLKPKEEININGMSFVFNYGYHPIPAKGHEIWAKTVRGQKQLTLYFTGDTMAVPSDQDVFGKTVKGIWNRIQDGVMSVERGLDILKHYFLIPLTSLCLMDQKLIRQQTGKTAADLIADFVVSENTFFKLNEHPDFFQMVRQYIADLAANLKNQKQMPLFLIEGGIAGIHIPPAVTQGFVNEWVKYLGGFFEGSALEKIAATIKKNVLIYHTSEKATADVGALRWQAGYRGIVDFNLTAGGAAKRSGTYWLSRLRHDFVLKEAPQKWLKSLLRKGQIITVPKGEKFISKESADDSLFFVLEGRVSVLRADGRVLISKDSGFIGEGPLLGETRSHDVRADESTLVLKLSPTDLKNNFGRLVVSHLKALRYTRTSFADFLAVTQLTLKGISSLWDGLLQFAKPRVLLPGEQLFAKGDTDRSLFFVTGGQALVKLEDTQVAIPTGQFVGEMAYALDAPRSADVIAGDEGLSVLEIFPENLDEMVAIYPGLGADIRLTALAHVAPGLAGVGLSMGLPLAH